MGLSRTETSILPFSQLVMQVRPPPPSHIRVFQPPLRPTPHPKPPDLTLLSDLSPPSLCISRCGLFSPTNLPPSLLSVSHPVSTPLLKEIGEFRWLLPDSTLGGVSGTVNISISLSLVSFRLFITAVCSFVTGVYPALSPLFRSESNLLFYPLQVSLTCWNNIPVSNRINGTVRQCRWNLKPLLVSITLYLVCLPANDFGLHLLWFWLVNYHYVYSFVEMYVLSVFLEILNRFSESEARMWIIAQSEPPILVATQLSPPLTPSIGAIYCVDAAQNAESLRCGVGWILGECSDSCPIQWRDEDSSSKSHVSSALIAEAWAVLCSLQHALLSGRRILQVRSASLALVKILSSLELHNYLHGIFQEIRFMQQKFIPISFVYFSRTFNCRADVLAKKVFADFIALST